jgi:DUF1365 family protein
MSSRLVRFDPRDVGFRDGSDPLAFVNGILTDYGLDSQVRHRILVTMPRVLGYVFNPVSFYLCLDGDTKIRAVVAEVHNTFGEQPSYLCARSDHGALGANDWLEARKLFHVSPFLARDGSYRFRFALENDRLGVWIDYRDNGGRPQLLTSLTGRLEPLTSASLSRAFWLHPLVTLKAISLIHWQALKLVFKGLPMLRKPNVEEDKLTPTVGLKKKSKN